MPAPQCMSEDGNPAVFVGTMLANGDAVALCDECLVAWTAAVLQLMTGVDPAPFLAAISDDEPPEIVEGDPMLDDAPVDLDDAPDPTPSNGRRGRTSARSRAAGTVDVRSDGERQTPIDADAPAA